MTMGGSLKMTGNVLEIPLTQGKAVLVSECDYESLIKYKWYYNNGYAVRAEWDGEKQKRVYMHRHILQAPKHLQVDHVDRDRLNNTRENLRLCTKGENERNKVKKTTRRSKYRGVQWDKGKWRADIQHEGKKIYLGRFLSEEDGALAYNEAVLLYHGDFGVLNVLQKKDDF